MLKFNDMSFKYLFSIGILLFCYSCKSPQQRFSEYKGAIITLGYGGGFTGEYKEYSLLENGGVYQFNTLSLERKYFGKLDSNVTKQLFKNYITLNLNKKILNNPGNMSHYIIYKGDKINHKLLWSNMDEINPNVRLYYEILMENFKNFKK